MVISFHMLGQNGLSTEERRSLIEQIKKEILDSLRNNQAGTVLTPGDSIKEEKAKELSKE